MIVLNCTNYCNYRCGYCYGEYYKPPHSEDEFTTEQLFKLVDELGRLRTRSLTLAGGEPLIRKDIGEVIKRIKENGMECGMNTNGSLIPEKLEELKNIDMVTVSFDGPKEMNDKNRGDGSYEKTIAGIIVALNAGLKVHINCVLTRYNLGAIDWIIDFGKRYHVQTEFNILFNQSTEKQGSSLFEAEQNEYRQALSKIADLKSQGAPILFSEKVYRFAANWPDLSKKLYRGSLPPFKYIPCYSGRFMGFIDSDGKVYPCPQLIDCIEVKDCKEVGFKAAWDHLKNQDCKACYFPCFNEFNSIFNLDFSIIFQNVISSLKDK